MSEKDKIKSLEELLKKIGDDTKECDPVSVEAVVKAAGQRSFGPMLLVPGLIGFSPLSGIPGMPTLVGIMVLLVTSQLLLGRSEFWLPQFVLRRSISHDRFGKAMKVLGKAARFIDRFIKPRLSFFTKGPAKYFIAVLCLLLSLTSPFLELLPFAITGVGATISAFALALIADDGALAAIALVLCAGTITVTAIAAF